MGLSDVIKKVIFKIDLSKYKLNREEKEEVYNLYNYVINIFLNKFSNELKKNKDINKMHINNKIIDDIARIVSMNKSFIINDITMEYIINKKNSFTILQFLNNFHYLAQSNHENNIFNYNLSIFIKYLMNRSYEDKDYLNKVLNDNSLSKITNDYLNTVLEFKNIEDTEEALDLYNYIVGIIWYDELINNYPDIVLDMGIYIINNYDEIKEEIMLDSTISESSYDDNVTSILDSYKNKKVKKI